MPLTINSETVVSPNEVKPGDLITADLFNRLRADLTALTIRVDGLQAGTAPVAKLPPVISGPNVSAGIQAGSLLTLTGLNFLDGGRTPVVVFGSVAIGQFLAATSTSLSFPVPDFGATQAQDVSLFVLHAGGPSQVVTARVLPRVPTQGGNLFVSDQQLPQGQIVEGKLLQLQWLVHSQTLLPVTYSWALVFTNLGAVAESAWRSTLSVTPLGPLTLSASTPQVISASVQVPVGVQTADIALRVTATDNSFSRTSSMQRLVINQTAVVSDSRVLVTLDDIPPFGPFGLNGGRSALIALPNGTTQIGAEVIFGGTATLMFNVHVTGDSSANGSYRYLADLSTVAPGWSVNPVIPASGSQNASSDLPLEVTLRNNDTSHSSLVSFLIVTAEHLPPTGGPSDFKSFISVPIKGVAA